MPDLNLDDFAALGIKATRDLEGAGFPKRQAEDLLRAGFDVHALHALERDQESERQWQESQ